MQAIKQEAAAVRALLAYAIKAGIYSYRRRTVVAQAREASSSHSMRRQRSAALYAGTFHQLANQRYMRPSNMQETL